MHSEKYIKKHKDAASELADIINQLETWHEKNTGPVVGAKTEAVHILNELHAAIEKETDTIEWENLEQMAKGAEKIAAEIRAKHASTDRRTKDINDSMPCPICEGTIFYRIAASNGHIAARCTTNNCISFQE